MPLRGDAAIGHYVPQALRFDMQIADVITPDDYLHQPDPIYYITARYRKALESAFLEAPHQVLWMHRFWKSRPRHELENKPFPKSLENKLRQLPWLTSDHVQAIIARSDFDAKHPEKRR